MLALQHMTDAPLHSRRFRRVLLGVVVFCTSFAPLNLSPTWAQPPAAAAATAKAVDEYSAKTAQVAMACKFIQWPGEDSSHEPFRIGVLGPNPYGDKLTRMAQKFRKIRQRDIEIVHFASASDYRPCDVLLVTEGTDPESTRQLLAKIARQSVLVWGETPNFVAQWGGCFGFVIDSAGAMAIEVNVPELQRRGLVCQAGYLSLTHVKLVNTKK